MPLKSLFLILYNEYVLTFIINGGGEISRLKNKFYEWRGKMNSVQKETWIKNLPWAIAIEK